MKHSSLASFVAGFVAIASHPGCRFDFSEDALAESCDGKPDGAECSKGRCRNGACCAGCWNGKSCETGDVPTACGVEGVVCASCAAPTAACDTGACVATRAVVSLGAGAAHTCASDRMKTLSCWGNSDHGQAGKPASGVTTIPKPKDLTTGEWIEVSAAGVASAHSCAIHFAGSLWCWGDDAFGQLGVGGVGESDAPLKVDDASWLHVAAGNEFTCAIQLDGRLWCWGSDANGQLGTEGDSSIPRVVGTESEWTQLAAGARHVLAIDSQHTLYSWGDDNLGQLGRSGVADRPGIVGTEYSTVAAGEAHSCGVRDNGALFCWGAGQNDEPSRVGTDDDWVSVAAGRAHSCALKRDGTLWCWGDDSRGQLGLGGGQSVSVPTRVQGRDDWKLLASGADHACAVTRSGLLFCWGAGDKYQHGLGVIDDVPVPTAVSLEGGP